MRQNFSRSLLAVLVHEGGYVNHPKDPGGATNKGVTQRVYDDWRVKQKLAPRSVKQLEQGEIEAIYRKLYWDACRCDDLPAGVDYCVFDFAVNSGVSRASRYLQQAAGVADDGHIGPITLASIGRLDKDATAGRAGLIDQICDLRLGFLKRLPIFATFGKGWTRRVEDVRALARTMA